MQYYSPNEVKIAWTLEAQPIEPSETCSIHETRVVATDVEAKSRFMKYWRWARFGIISILLILMPAVRRESEKRWNAFKD